MACVITRVIGAFASTRGSWAIASPRQRFSPGLARSNHGAHHRLHARLLGDVAVAVTHRPGRAQQHAIAVELTGPPGLGVADRRAREVLGCREASAPYHDVSHRAHSAGLAFCASETRASWNHSSACGASVAESLETHDGSKRGAFWSNVPSESPGGFTQS